MKTEIQKIENQINNLKRELIKLEFKKFFGFAITDTDKLPTWVNVVLKDGARWVFLSTAEKGKSGIVNFFLNKKDFKNELEVNEFQCTHEWYTRVFDNNTVFVNREGK